MLKLWGVVGVSNSVGSVGAMFLRVSHEGNTYRFSGSAVYSSDR
jgi:hypothetical protein